MFLLEGRDQAKREWIGDYKSAAAADDVSPPKRLPIIDYCVREF